MSKVTDVRVVDSERAAALPKLSDEVRVALTDIAATAREGLLAMSVAVVDVTSGRDRKVTTVVIRRVERRTHGDVRPSLWRPVWTMLA